MCPCLACLYVFRPLLCPFPSERARRKDQPANTLVLWCQSSRSRAGLESGGVEPLNLPGREGSGAGGGRKRGPCAVEERRGRTGVHLSGSGLRGCSFRFLRTYRVLLAYSVHNHDSKHRKPRKQALYQKRVARKARWTAEGKERRRSTLGYL